MPLLQAAALLLARQNSGGGGGSRPARRAVAAKPSLIWRAWRGNDEKGKRRRQQRCWKALFDVCSPTTTCHQPPTICHTFALLPVVMNSAGVLFSPDQVGESVIVISFLFASGEDRRWCRPPAMAQASSKAKGRRAAGGGRRWYAINVFALKPASEEKDEKRNEPIIRAFYRYLRKTNVT